MPRNVDLVSDILQRITDKHTKLPAKIARLIEADIRRDWGGERHYIAKSGESGRAVLAERDAAIREQARKGERVKFLSRRWNISEKRVRQILATVNEVQRNAAANEASEDEQGNDLP